MPIVEHCGIGRQRGSLQPEVKPPEVKPPEVSSDGDVRSNGSFSVAGCGRKRWVGGSGGVGVRGAGRGGVEKVGEG